MHETYVMRKFKLLFKLNLQELLVLRVFLLYLHSLPSISSLYASSSPVGRVNPSVLIVLTKKMFWCSYPYNTPYSSWDTGISKS